MRLEVMPVTFATSIQRIFAHAIRPVSSIRGVGRVSRVLNRGCLKLGVPPVQKAYMRDGTRMLIDLRSQTEWFAYYSGLYDDAAIALIKKLLIRLDSDFLDVGGNIGMYAVRVAAGLENGRRTLCFEPMPQNVARIRENAMLNGVEDRLDIHPIALSDSEGQTELVLREDFEMGSGTGNASVAISDEADGRFRKISVHMRRLDDVLLELENGNFRVAKVDIEGHEDFFLRGGSDWLHRDRPVILTEINNWFYEKRGTTSSDVFFPALPENYEAALMRIDGSAYELEPCPIETLSGLRRVETCLIYPAEQRSLVLHTAR